VPIKKGMRTMKTSVRDVMSTPIVAVRRGATFKEMAAKLRDYRVSAFPVIDEDGKVIGVVSGADLLAKETLADGNAGIPGRLGSSVHHKQLEKAEGLTAADLMTHPAVTVKPEDTIQHAARLMYSLQVKRLPVVDAGGRLVGIVSRTDLLSVFDRPDEEILAEITDEVIARSFLMDPALFTVSVTDGVVTMQGDPESADLGHELVDAIRRVQGVVAVRDELAYPTEASIAGLYF
jgi:CBS-domain-containing membrane protein